MEDVARAEYPAMLAVMQPGQAVQTLNDRVKRISKLSIEIADWLQERRRIEEQYFMGMRKLAQFKVPNAQSELGVFHGPWTKVIDAVERISVAHQLFAEKIEKDVEYPLRSFSQRRDMQNLNNISNNLSLVAKDLEDAQEKSDKLSRKGGKASTQKVDAASTRLESVLQQWESQAPFVFESLQAMDESRINILRELLTQYLTHESDQAQRVQDAAVETLAVMLEVESGREVQGFVQKATHGKAQSSSRGATRRSSTLGGQTSASGPGSTPSTPNPASQQGIEDNISEHNSLPVEGKPESKLRRLGTMLGGGRRRQSVHAGATQFSPQKSSGIAFGRLGSSHGPTGGHSISRVLSPRTSSSNLQEHNRLSMLAENPVANHQSGPEGEPIGLATSNGVFNDTPAPGESLLDSPLPNLPIATVNGDSSNISSPLVPPPSQQSQDTALEAKDSEGFTSRAPMNDPISEAQRDGVEEGEQPFKLNIQNQPIDEEDPEAAQAALSNVANTLKLGSTNRRGSTLRGRRDVRHTMFAPVPVPVPGLPDKESESLPAVPGSPPRGTPVTRSPAPGLASESSVVAAASDTQSVRSGNSLGSLIHAKHPEMTGPGLNMSIVETVSAVFEQGTIKSASIVGEIACVINPSETADPSKTHEVIRINNYANLERIGPNRIFVHNASTDQSDQFSLDISYLKQPSTAFSYRVFSAEADPVALGHHAPILLNAQWKAQGDKLGLLMLYQLNPESRYKVPVTLHNLVFVASYEGLASGAQTKPSGVHLKDKHLIYWRLGDVTLTEAPQKIICRVNGIEGVEPTPGQVEARWEYVASGDEVLGSGISISRLEIKEKDVVESDPFADENPASSNPSLLEQVWVDVPTSIKLVSGKYEAK